MQKSRLFIIPVLLGLMCQPGLVFAKSNPPQLIENQVVEAACGECQFHLKGKGCNLAVRINGKAYFVDGTGIDEHGDAHASDGFCTTIRKARVSGQIVNGRFQASSFELLPFSGASY